MAHRVMLTQQLLSDPHQRAGFYVSARKSRQAIAAAGLGGFDYPTQLTGTTQDGNVTVYYDPSLGQDGSDLAQQFLQGAAQAYGDTQAFFAVPGSPVNVIIAALNGSTDGLGGAYHYGCNFNPGGDLYCDAAFGVPDVTTGLFVAELTESFMGAQAVGWDCGGSNGEALSRYLAETETGGANGALAPYASGPSWDQAGRPDWIDATEPTDTNIVSTGCGVVYLYWMQSQGFSAAQITQAGCPDGTLASNYASLTGSNTAWNDFIMAVNGLANGVQSDNPWV
jgi:hypothetical protein